MPSAEVNAAGVRATRQVLGLLGSTRLPESPAPRLEMEMLEEEATALMDRTLDLGDGDPAAGTVRAFEAGVLDVPWSPSVHNDHRLMPVRDRAGALRYLDPGLLPLPPRVSEYHRERLAERARHQGRPIGLEAAMADVMAVARG